MKPAGLFYIFLCLVFTVYGQIVLKWQIGPAGAFPETFSGKMAFLLRQFLNPWILSSFAAAFVASLAWMAAMTQLELSVAYPFMSLAIVCVMLLSALWLGEALTWPKAAGSLLIVGGLVILAQ